MTRHKFARWILALGLCLFVVVGSATATTWDASADYSITNGNPNGVWTYGYCPADISGGSASFVPYANQGVGFAGPLLFWFTGSNPLLVEKGLIAYNPQDTDYNPGWGLFPAHWLGYHPSAAADRPSVRWTSPVAGTVTVEIHCRAGSAATTTDEHLFVNNVEVWTDFINGSTQPEILTRQTIAVAVGDLVDFVGGDGGNGYGSDMTGFTLVIASGEPGQITGVVTSNLPGNPVLPGVTVTLDGSASTTTDDSGVYTFDATAGDHTLTFALAKYATHTHTVTVPSGGTATYSPMLETARLSGTVVSSEAGNPPVADVRVALAGTDIEAVTDAAGHYEFDLAPGTYTVSFAKSGYEPANISKVVESVQTNVLDQQITFVKEIWDAGYDFQTKQNPHYVWTYGYLDMDGLNFQPYDTGYFPFAGVPFAVWNAGDVHQVGGIAAKSYAAEQYVQYGGYFPPMPSSWPHMLGMHPGETGAKATIRWTAPKSGIVQIHACFSGLSSAGTTIDGHVYLNQSSIFDTIIDGFAGSPDSNYSDRSGPSPFVDRWFTLPIAAGDTLDFAVGYGDNGTWVNDITGLIATVEMTDVAPGDVSGVVVSDEPGNPPVEGARVATEDGRFWTLTGYDGGYYMVIPSGNGIKLIASKEGYASVEKTIDLPANGAATCDFILPSGQISGWVEDSVTHDPLVGALIRTTDGSYSSFTGFDGSYSITLPPGTYTFEVSLAGYIRQTVEVEIAGGVWMPFALVRDPDFNAHLDQDFSLGYNPNGVWTYGYYYLDMFTVYDPFSNQPYQVAIPGKLMGLGDVAASIGVILKNFTRDEIVFAGHIPGGTTAFHPGAQNQMPAARWTAPGNAKVLVTVSFSDGATPRGGYWRNVRRLRHEERASYRPRLRGARSGYLLVEFLQRC